MIIALLGAEGSGKSTLAQALVQELQALLATTSATTPHVALVPEVLRNWCETHGRTPLAHEQADVAQQQLAAVLNARTRWGPSTWVVTDTSPLMTAVYSEHYFNDRSLTDWAHAAHRQHHDLTLLMGLDLPWQADGPWRDGPAVQLAIDTRLRAHLQGLGLPFQTIYGQGTHRVGAALQAVAAALTPAPATTAANLRSQAQGLVSASAISQTTTRAHEATNGNAIDRPSHPTSNPTDSQATRHAAWAEAIKKRANSLLNTGDRDSFYSKLTSACEACSDPDCEHTLFTRLLAQRPAQPLSGGQAPPAGPPPAG